ncbi:hypothetical protein ZWY2020_038784 [Hordeum vulgare]|nr:hypothetical protein ZWY2020_038784 [Hordeum vulgare]
MEPVDVLEDLHITLARKINFLTRQDRRVKAKVAKEEKLKKQLAAGWPAGGDGRGGRGGKTGTQTVQKVSWPEPYKPSYYYVAKQLGTSSGTVLFIVDVK